MGRKFTIGVRTVMFGVLSFVMLLGGCTKEQETFVKKKFNLEEGEDGLAPLYSSNKSGVAPVSAYYVVVLKDNIDWKDLDFESDKITEFLSSQKDKIFRYAVKGFTIQLTDKDLKKVRRDPNVKYVEQDQMMKISGTQFTAPWGLDRIDQTSAPLSGSFTYETTGSTIDAYIFDTGIKPDHNEFTGRIRPGFNAITAGVAPDDDNGHGTHVAGVVGGTRYGVAKAINLIPVKVLDRFGTGTFTQIIAGIDWAIANHTTKPAVGNVSISGQLAVSLDEAIRRAIADGIVISVAAGNNAEATVNTSPGRVIEAITVGSVTNTDQWSAFSNFGPEVDILAPGSSITSAWHTGVNDISVVSGTSMATPHVTGAAALYLEKFPGSTPQQVQQGLKNFAVIDEITEVPTETANLLLQVNFNAPPLPGAPALTSPVTASVDLPQALSLSWNASAGAASYDLQFSDRADFSNVLLTLNGLTQTRQPISGLGFGATYYWRIRANNATGSGLWSTPSSFTTALNTVAAPVLSTPVSGSTNQPTILSLTWNPVNGATSYDLQFSDNADFSKILLTLNGLTQTRQPISGLGFGATYFWRIRANNAGVAGTWSVASSFTTVLNSLSAPVLALPTSGATNQPVILTLTWNPVNTAVGYDLQFSDKPDFSRIILTLNGLTQTRQPISGLGFGATYYWRIRATAASGVSAWSVANSFITTANSAVPPVLSLPANGAANQSQNLTLSWSPVANATGYNLQFSDNPAFTTVLLTLNNLNATSQPISGLAFGDTYYWRISTITPTGTSQWSAPNSFATAEAVNNLPATTLPAPTLLLPTDRITGASRTPTLSWNAVQGATTYDLQVSNSTAFTTTVIDQKSIAQTSFNISSVLAGRTLYLWRVRSVSNGVAGPWSTALRFTTVR
jgi:subtilisin family serine protease